MKNSTKGVNIMSNKEARLAYIKCKRRILPNAVIKAINDPNSVNDPKVIQIIDNLDAELLYTSLRPVGLGHMHAEITLCKILKKDFKSRSLDVSRFAENVLTK